MEAGKAARLAASKYHNKLYMAVIEYASLLGYDGIAAPHDIELAMKYELSENLSSNDMYGKLKNQMLQNLKQYRHPTETPDREFYIFFGLDSFNFESKAHNDPKWFHELRKFDISKDMLDEINEYIQESELRKIELANIKAEHDVLKDKFEQAAQVFHEPLIEHRERTAHIPKILGFSTGKPAKRIDKFLLWKDYVFLIRKDGKEREEAVYTLRDNYGIGKTRDKGFLTTCRYLYSYRKYLLDKERDNDYIYQRKKKWLRGIVPDQYSI